MKIEVLPRGIVYFRAKTQRELASAFMRLQEFYESPFDDIRGKFFTVAEYKRRYAAEYGEFTYYEDWAGFNVPGSVVRRFWFEFDGALTKEEKAMKRQILRALGCMCHGKDSFYVIGTYQDAVMDHEVAHAMWYLDEQYREQAKTLLNNLTPKEFVRIKNAVKALGYDETVVLDEMQAYLSTSPLFELHDILEIDEALPLDPIAELQWHFFKNRKRFISA